MFVWTLQDKRYCAVCRADEVAGGYPWIPMLSVNSPETEKQQQPNGYGHEIVNVL